MRILLVSQYYFPERNSVSDIAEGLVKLGHNVTVITGKPNYGFNKILPEYKKVKFEILNGVEIHRLNLRPRKKGRISVSLNYLSFHRNAKRFASNLKQKFDVVLSISLSPVISIAPAIVYSKKNNVPHLLFCEDLWPESTIITHAVKKNSLIYKLLYKWSVSLYKKCDDIVVSSPSFKDYFFNVLNIKDKSFDYINQPIIVSKSSKIEPIKYEAKYNLVYAGNIGSIQMVDKLTEAMKYLKNDDIKLHLMGMGGELDSIKKQIIQEGLSDKVFYHGALPIEQAESYYFNADALIVSLKNEGYVGKTIPNKAIQYLKYGKPIIGVISGDGKKLLEAANGSVFSNEDPEEIASAFMKICKLSEKEKEALGKNNKSYFDNYLSIEKIILQLEQKLVDIAKK